MCVCVCGRILISLEEKARKLANYINVLQKCQKKEPKTKRNFVLVVLANFRGKPSEVLSDLGA